METFKIGYCLVGGYALSLLSTSSTDARLIVRLDEQFGQARAGNPDEKYLLVLLCLSNHTHFNPEYRFIR